MPAKKLYFTEEDRKAATKESYKKYNSSDKGKGRTEKFMEDHEYDPEKQKEYSEKYFAGLSEERLKEIGIAKKEYMHSTARSDPKRHMLNWARKRAKDKGIDFSITSEDIYIPDVCPVLGIPLFKGEGSRTDNSPSLDRIDNTKGYIKGNVCVVSFRANALKNNGTVLEFKAIIEYMENNSGMVWD